MKSTVEIDLTGMSPDEIEIYEKATDIQDSNPETYGLRTDEELLNILIKGLNKEFVATIMYVENAYSDLKTYNLFGGLIREG